MNVNKISKLLFSILGLLLLMVTGLLAYLKFALPNVGPAPNLKIQSSPQKLARGKYLAQHVMLCIDCHSSRNWKDFSAPLIPGSEGQGGEAFDQTLGFPGKFIAPNITPANLKNWTDGEIFRAITSGVDKEGRALFSIMPSHRYGQLAQEDIEAVIIYIRGLKPIENQVEASQADFPMNFIINMIPKKPTLTSIPPQSDVINYGKYLTTAAACMDCHTKQDKGKFVGEPFAGGFAFRLRDGSTVRSANLTPDKDTGLGNWTEEDFVQAFKQYTRPDKQKIPVAKGSFQTIMPWCMYADMQTQDLKAIYQYLKSLPAVKNKVAHFTPA